MFSAANDTINTVESFSEGLARVILDDGVGFIDRHGNVAIPAQPPYTSLSSFSYRNGMAVIYKDGRKGYMNMEGEIVIPPQCINAWDFNEEGIAEVQVGYGEGPSYINTNGELIWRYEAR